MSTNGPQKFLKSVSQVESDLWISVSHFIIQNPNANIYTSDTIVKVQCRRGARDGIPMPGTW